MTPPPDEGSERAPILQVRGVTKSFGQVEALRGADFDCYPGEVTALVGDNGAGKSTLVKILSGVHAPDGGEVVVAGRSCRFDSSVAAHEAGIETIYQDLALAPDLGSAPNLFLGRELRKSGWLGRLGFLDERAMQEQTAARFKELGVTANPRATSVRGLSGGQRQGVAVARAVSWAKQIVLLDEPTAALGVVQTQRVLELVRTVASRGLGVVLISHSMPDVLAVADRIEVLRLGKRVARFTRADASIERVVAAMTGGGQ